MTDEDPQVTKDGSERTRSARILGTAVVVVLMFWVLSAWIAQHFEPWVRWPFLVIAGLISIGGVAAAIAILFKPIHSTGPNAGSVLSGKDDVPAIRAAVVVIMTIVIVFGLLALGGWAITGCAKELDTAVKLPLLVIAGLVSLIALLAVMAIAFKTVHLANQTQALGLPEGTVRAVIALSLILIFAVVTVYLFSDLSGRDKQDIAESATTDTAAKATDPAAKTTDTAAKVLNTPAAQATPVVPTPPGAPATAQDLTSTDPVTKVATAAKLAADAATKAAEAASKAAPLSPLDTRRASRLAAAQDFAKQLLIMLGTLITSITSFYFGSKTGTDTTGRAAPSTSAKLTGVDNPKFASSDDMKITAQGSGLQTAQQVTLRSIKGERGTTGFSSSDTAVHFTVPTSTPAATWDVVVKMADGTEATLPRALEIT